MLAQKMQDAVDAFVQYKAAVDHLLECHDTATKSLSSDREGDIARAFDDLATAAARVALAEAHIKGVCLDMLCALEAQSIEKASSYQSLMARISQ